jgi:hypothetical protein
MEYEIDLDLAYTDTDLETGVHYQVRIPEIYFSFFRNRNPTQKIN